MQPQPLLHIGYHKTATTWLQKNLYPAISNADYLSRPLVRDVFFNTTAWGFAADAAREQLLQGRHQDRRLIISEEDFCGYTENGGLLEALSRDLARRLQETFPQADVVIFIRNQLDMIRSSYLQYVRTGGTHSVRRYLNPYPVTDPYHRRWYKKPLLTKDHFSYQHLIKHYQQLFGADQVHVFCYEAFVADSRGFVRDFARRLQLDVDIDRLSFARRNESLGRLTLLLSRLLGPFTRWHTSNRLVLLPILPRWLTKAGIKALNKTPLSGAAITNRQLFGERLEQQLWQYYAGDNQALLALPGLQLPLRRYGYPLPPE